MQNESICLDFCKYIFLEIFTTFVLISHVKLRENGLIIDSARNGGAGFVCRRLISSWTSASEHEGVEPEASLTHS